MSVRISNYQLASLLAVSAIFSETTCNPYAYTYSMDWVFRLLFGAAIILLLYAPHMIASGKLKISPLEYISGKSRVAGWIFGIIIIARLIYTVLRLTSELEFYVTNTIMPYFSFVALLVTSFAVILYALSKGIQAIARLAPILVPIYIVLLVIFVISTRDKTHFVNLYSPLADGIFHSGKDLLQNIIKNDEIFFYAVLCGITHGGKNNDDGKSYKSVLMYVPFVTLISMFVYAFYVVILGRFLNNVAYPFYTIAGFTDSTAICMDVAIGMIAGVTKISVAFICAGMAVDSFIKRKDPIVKGLTVGKLTAMILAVLAAVTSVFFISRNNLIIVSDTVYSAAIMAVVTIVMPLTALIIPKGGKPKNEKTAPAA